jgi:hypothetical protein
MAGGKDCTAASTTSSAPGGKNASGSSPSQAATNCQTIRYAQAQLQGSKQGARNLFHFWDARQHLEGNVNHLRSTSKAYDLA